jgi:hypothetical protein
LTESGLGREKFSRQALLDIGRFECRAAHGDSAVLRRNGEADCGQRTGRAIGAHAGIDTDAPSRPGVALTSRSSGGVCAPAPLTVNSTVVATAHHDALRSRATFSSSSTFLEPFARPQTACFVIAFPNARQLSGSHTGRKHCSLTRERIHPVATPTPTRRCSARGSH